MMMGRVHSLLDREGNRHPVANEVGVDRVLMSRALALMPTYDFFMPLMPSPGGVNRNAMSFGHLLGYRPHPTHVILGAGVVIDFLSQMDKRDQERWVVFRESARKTVEENAKAAEEKSNGEGRGGLIALPDARAVATVEHGRRRG